MAACGVHLELLFEAGDVELDNLCAASECGSEFKSKRLCQEKSANQSFGRFGEKRLMTVADIPALGDRLLRVESLSDCGFPHLAIVRIDDRIRRHVRIELVRSTE